MKHLPFFISLTQDTYQLYFDVPQRIIDLDILLSGLYKLYLISKAFEKIDKEDNISKEIYPYLRITIAENQKSPFELFFDGIDSFVVNFDADNQVIIKDFIRLIKYNFRKKWIKQNNEIERNEQQVLQSIENYLFLPRKITKQERIPFSPVFASQIMAFLFQSTSTIFDGIVFLKKLLDIKLFTSSKPIKTQNKNLEIILINVEKLFAESSKKNPELLKYLESRWGKSMWKNGKAMKMQKELPSKKQILCFLADWKFLLNSPMLLSQENMQFLIRLKNLFYGQQHHFKLDMNDLEQANK